MRPATLAPTPAVLEVWCKRDRGGKHKTKVRRREREKKTDNAKPSQPYYKQEQVNLLVKQASR